MKRIILFFAIITAITSTLIAQERIEIELTPNEPVRQEVSITNDLFGGFDILLELRWDERNNRLLMVFDRRNISGGGDEYILALPMMREAMSIKNIEDCRSRRRNLWRGKMANDIRQLNYFMESEDLRSNFEPCFRFVSVNNELNFSFAIINDEKISILFNGLYVLKNARRPWFAFSSRDMRIEYKAEPVRLEITLKRDPCAETGNLINALKNRISLLENLKLEAENAAKDANCTAVNNIKNNRINDFPINNPAWANHAECEELTGLIKTYQATRESILNIECTPRIEPPVDHSQPVIVSEPVVPPPPVLRCNLEEINNRLLPLQMAINAKIVAGENMDEERRLFDELKSNAVVAPGSRRDRVEAYESYVRNIEGLLNR
ncbi:MAG: hypothetical protein LBI15_02315 [Dysgonamonadaceae bacterium]|jgi:hypothetical protein|nr:hypothetical protein [Dysgonamonadaceae bacterium]